MDQPRHRFTCEDSDPKPFLVRFMVSSNSPGEKSSFGIANFIIVHHKVKTTGFSRSALGG